MTYVIRFDPDDHSPRLEIDWTYVRDARSISDDAPVTDLRRKLANAEITKKFLLARLAI